MKTTKITIHHKSRRIDGGVSDRQTSNTMIDGGEDVNVSFSGDQLVLKGPQVDLTYNGVLSFSLEHVEIK